MSIPGYFTPKEIMDRFSWTRQQLNATAQRECWHKVPVGRGFLYQQSDVEEFATARVRTELLHQLGWVGKGLVRHDEYDLSCPICGAFAVWKPGKDAQEEIELDQAETRPWLCKNKHSGE